MKKLKHESELLKIALATGIKYAQKRGVVEFEATDSHDDKLRYIYRLLVHDKKLQPLAKDQESLPNIRHKLAIWIQKLLPEGHALK